MGRVRTELDRGTLALPALYVALLAAGGTLWALTQGTGFFSDEWNFIYGRLGFTAGNLLDPHSGSLNLVPLLLYQGVIGAFGLDTYLPFQLLSIGFVLLCSLLLFVYLRSHVAPWVAFWPAAFLPFFGAAYWTQTISLGLLWTIPLAAGLGALIALGRRDLRGDVAACLLLIVAVASHSPGLVFPVGAAVTVTLRPPPERWRRAWTWALPLALYAAWGLWAERQDGGSPADLSQIWKLPEVAVESLSAVLGGIAGLYHSPEAVTSNDAVRTDLTAPIAVAVIAIVGALALVGRLRREALVGISMALAYWATIALVLSEKRTPTDSRYLYVAAVVVVIALTPLLRRRPASLFAWTAMGIVFVAGLVPNVKGLEHGAEAQRNASRQTAAAATGIELAEDRVDPSFVPTNPVPELGVITMPSSAGSYLSIVETYGSPALSVEVLLKSDPFARRVADGILSRALGLGLDPVSKSSVWHPGAEACTRVAPDSEDVVKASPDSTTAITASSDGAALVRIGRFSDRPFMTLGTVPAGESALLSIPGDRADRPWRLGVRSVHEVTVCPSPPPRPAEVTRSTG